jgi:hypothetical protein
VRSLRLIVLTLAAVLPAAAPAAAAPARTPPPAERIINGHVPSQAWPAQTSVSFNGMVCGGTLVSARWVLTAGHCATDNLGAALAPTVFALNIGGTTRGNGSPATVDQVVVNPDFTPETAVAGPPTNDLTLLHLTSPAPREPMRLIGDADAETAFWSPGVQATVVGWGITESGFQSTTLLEAQVPIVGDSACSTRLGASGFSSTSMVCAGGGSTDTCGGDSGGPLIVPRAGEFTLVGVTSWGLGCGQPGDPGVYARVGAPAINAWLRSTVPTVALSLPATAAAPDEQVSLSATVTLGAHSSPPTSVTWDLDGDGAFDDASGATATTAFATAGSHVVRVQALFADGDRAVTREVVTVDAAVVTPEPTPEVTTAQPAPQATPAQIQQIQKTLAPAAIGTVTVPGRLKLRTLRGTSLRVRFHCERACQITGRMTLDGATARRFGLKRGATIGSASASRASGGSSTLTVRLTSRAKRALRNRGRFTVRLATELRGDGAIPVRGTRTIAVNR